VSRLSEKTFRARSASAEERTLAAQFQIIKGNGIDELRDPNTEKTVQPPQFKSGDMNYPYERALKQ
jgi:hypothetical protein